MLCTSYSDNYTDCVRPSTPTTNNHLIPLTCIPTHSNFLLKTKSYFWHLSLFCGYYPLRDGIGTHGLAIVVVNRQSSLPELLVTHNRGPLVKCLRVPPSILTFCPGNTHCSASKVYGFHKVAGSVFFIS